MFPFCLSAGACVRAATVNTINRPILKSIRRIFTKLAVFMHFVTETNASDLGVKRSKFKVALLISMIAILLLSVLNVCRPTCSNDCGE